MNYYYGRKTPRYKRVARRLHIRNPLTSGPSVTHIRIGYAASIAVGTGVVGQVIAWVPTYGTAAEADLISIGSSAIAATFMIANAVHSIASSNTVSTTEVHKGAISAARDEVANARAGAIAAARTEAGAVVREEIAKVDFSSIVTGAVNADLTAVIEEKARMAVVGTLGSLALPAPPAQSDIH